MDLKQYKAALEAVLFAVAEPVSAEKLAQVLGIEPQVVERLCGHLQDEYAEEAHGIQLLCLEGRWQFATKPVFGEQVKAALDHRRNVPLSPAAMEVLAIIAYNQPVTRSFIEQVRGVDSSGVVQSLTQKGLIEETGRLDLPGRPIAFGTTDVFLRSFGISSISELPPLHGDEMSSEEVAARMEEAAGAVIAAPEPDGEAEQ